RDRIGTSLALEGQRDPFAALAVDEGRRAAAAARPERAIPLRAGRAWRWWPAALAAVVAAAVWAPERPSRGERIAAQRMEVAARAREVAGGLQEVVEAVKRIEPAPAAATEEQL